MLACQAGKGENLGMVYTYREDIGLLDSQAIFDQVMVNGHDMYELHTGL